MAIPRPTNPDEIARRRKFYVLCAVGAAVVILGMALPSMLVNPQSPPESSHPTEASAKALPPSSEKKLVDAKASTDLAVKPSEATDTPGLGALLTRLVGGTLVVLLLCGGTAYGVGRWLKGKTSATSTGPLKLIATLPLGSRCSVYLIEAGDQHLVAGIDATGLKAMLHLPGGINEVEESEPIAAAATPSPGTSEAPGTIFAARFPILRSIPESSGRTPD